MNMLILLAEDEPNDVFFFKRALKKAQIPVDVQTVSDGKLAMDYLGGKGAYADRSMFPLPSMIFLDIKMPHATGIEVLNWIKQQEHLRNIPCVMISSSEMPRDRDDAFRIGALDYVVKPPTMEGFAQGWPRWQGGARATL
jgi:CheY-like chemotaxis protein